MSRATGNKPLIFSKHMSGNTYVCVLAEGKEDEGQALQLQVATKIFPILLFPRSVTVNSLACFPSLLSCAF